MVHKEFEYHHSIFNIAHFIKHDSKIPYFL